MRLAAADLVAYAAATWDWNPIHFDAEAAAAAGLPRPVVDGQMLGALMAIHAVAAAGAGAELRRLSFRIGSMVFAGDHVRLQGEVSGLEPEASAGRRLRIRMEVTCEGRAVVEGAELELVLR